MVARTGRADAALGAAPKKAGKDASPVMTTKAEPAPGFGAGPSQRQGRIPDQGQGQLLTGDDDHGETNTSHRRRQGRCRKITAIGGACRLRERRGWSTVPGRNRYIRPRRLQDVQRHVDATLVNLDERERWIELVNMVESRPDEHASSSTPAPATRPASATSARRSARRSRSSREPSSSSG